MIDWLIVDHLSVKVIKRIFAKVAVNRETGCWNWTAYCDKGGYGRLSFRGHSSCVAVRVLYAWLVGPIPNGRGRDVPNLDHIVCNNSSCVNPAHVVLSTVKANTLRGNSPHAINSRKTHCVHGHLLPAEVNDLKRNKRYCIVCSREAMRIKRLDPAYREAMKSYMKEYGKTYKRRRSNDSNISADS